jgi:hypothetical protein
MLLNRDKEHQNNGEMRIVKLVITLVFRLLYSVSALAEKIKIVIKILQKAHIKMCIISEVRVRITNRMHNCLFNNFNSTQITQLVGMLVQMSQKEAAPTSTTLVILAA